ncbi:hypothetical protein BCR34DRAFT_479758 [Clohesyomyces aquaticus]|uniref:Uncharacterized protein n=1 Tax=Clohesyomyces aquaticus TaxID=1231657 RepID=A0A1Y1ZVP7_9PLEO|nr:hypothetical protein BCR34DRAFT_479758 [Clohesyomyces aquaticus]
MPPDEETRFRKPRPSSRSPYRAPRSHDRHHHHSRRPRTRSRSPHTERHDRHKRRRSRSPAPRPVVLPFKAQPLSKREYGEYKPLFASYLDIQKQLYLEDLDEKEVRGRWKSFVGRWNRGDLAEGWYDPATLQKAGQTASSQPRRPTPPSKPRDSPERASAPAPADADPDSDDDEIGPAPPRDISLRRAGPAVPRLDDLQYRDELNEEDRSRDRSNYVDDIRYERKTDRKAQKERLEELVPRADPGSRERQLEKKRETTSTLKEFRDAKEAGDVEVPEADLLGDDGLDAFKKRKKDMERKKTEREIRREEIMRAREAERDERLAGRRQKEEKTMEYLRQIAKDRFG